MVGNSVDTDQTPRLHTVCTGVSVPIHRVITLSDTFKIFVEMDNASFITVSGMILLLYLVLDQLGRDVRKGAFEHSLDSHGCAICL